jgi:hypothetical protein
MSEYPFHRVDIDLKKSIRTLRRYFRNQFKNSHPELVSRRVVNCTSTEVYVAVKDTLINKLHFQDCNKELVYYLVGILNLKSLRSTKLRNSLKQEVDKFLECVRKFSKARFFNVMKSKLLKKI